jgi:hypothetical protein
MVRLELERWGKDAAGPRRVGVDKVWGFSVLPLFFFNNYILDPKASIFPHFNP